MDFYVVLTVFCLFTPSYGTYKAGGIKLTWNEYFVPAAYWFLINIFYIRNTKQRVSFSRLMFDANWISSLKAEFSFPMQNNFL